MAGIMEIDMMKMDYIIETESLTKKYGKTVVVEDVSLHVKRGEIYGLIGKNGAGKTTFVKLLLRCFRYINMMQLTGILVLTVLLNIH